MINKLREINNKLILKYKLENNNMKLLKQRVINELLANDNCFLEIPIETAYNILSDLEFKQDEIKNVYLKLTEPKK